MTAIENGQQILIGQKSQPKTAVTRKWRPRVRDSASYDSFVVQQTLVLRKIFSGVNRQLLEAAKR